MNGGNGTEATALWGTLEEGLSNATDDVDWYNVLLHHVPDDAAAGNELLEGAVTGLFTRSHAAAHVVTSELSHQPYLQRVGQPYTAVSSFMRVVYRLRSLLQARQCCQHPYPAYMPCRLAEQCREEMARQIPPRASAPLHESRGADNEPASCGANRQMPALSSQASSHLLLTLVRFIREYVSGLDT